MLITSLSASAGAQSLVLGDLTAHPSVHALGFEWPLTGDTNHDASCTVSFRVQGSEAWVSALTALKDM